LICSLPRVCLADGFAQRWLLLPLGLMLWMAVGQLCYADTLPAGWGRLADRAVALFLCLYVIAHQIPARIQLNHLGSASACTVVVVLVMNYFRGVLVPCPQLCFALGNINILVNTAGPVLFA